MSEDFRNFPTYNQAIKGIEKLKNIEWPIFENFKQTEDYVKAIEDIIFQEFEIIPSALQFFKPDKFNLSIFRARETSTFKNIDLISEHSYPPLNITSFGRCNFPENPVFYGSDHPITCLLEIIRESDYKEKEFCLTKWEILKSDTPVAIQPFFHSGLPKENGFSAIKEMETLKLDETFENKLDLDKKAGLLKLLDFFRTTFITDAKHKLSAAIAYNFLYAKHNLRTDILMYPSIYTQLTGMNMAISPNFVDNQMQLKRLYKIKITDINKQDKKYKLSIGEYAYVEKNVIMWNTFKKNDKQFEKFFSLDLKSYLNLS
ncbi:hypothetical protein LZ575_05685 [Antarcticibacterium sp. 1MA-6-2]|uniref:hypothetical protein n=1 Tax=Antarcticibacterium sp. 1MA-6-2 TaxID=2908210 RepID=UPI001F177388|nr:hypothetical protein [Antarcticibacterium sp. 1MA-6-2]UJH92092.1 hypothetical protein LZ575_05685 [Antarcticibacterium sp. 1MA-6-2]